MTLRVARHARGSFYTFIIVNYYIIREDMQGLLRVSGWAGE